MILERVAPGLHKRPIPELCRLPESLRVSRVGWIKAACRLNPYEIFDSKRIQNAAKSVLGFRKPTFNSRNVIINMRISRFSLGAVEDSNEVDRFFRAVDYPR